LLLRFPLKSPHSCRHHSTQSQRFSNFGFRSPSKSLSSVISCLNNISASTPHAFSGFNTGNILIFKATKIIV
jgi:hypothetical protein